MGHTNTSNILRRLILLHLFLEFQCLDFLCIVCCRRQQSEEPFFGRVSIFVLIFFRTKTSSLLRAHIIILINGWLGVHLVCACDEIRDAFTLLRPKCRAVRACSAVPVVLKLLVPGMRRRIRLAAFRKAILYHSNSTFVAWRLVDRMNGIEWLNPKTAENNKTLRSINIGKQLISTVPEWGARIQQFSRAREVFIIFCFVRFCFHFHANNNWFVESTVSDRISADKRVCRSMNRKIVRATLFISLLVVYSEFDRLCDRLYFDASA